MKTTSLAIRESLLVGDYALIHHFPELKQYLVERKYSKKAAKEVLGVIYIIDCFFTSRHKHKSDKTAMSLSQKFLSSLFTQKDAKSIVTWEEAEMLGTKRAVANKSHILSTFMYTSGTYDRDNKETRAWYFRPNILSRMFDFGIGYKNYIRNVPTGLRPSGHFRSIEVDTYPVIDKWLDTKTGLTGNKHSDIAAKAGVKPRTVKNWVAPGRLITHPNLALSGTPIYRSGEKIISYLDAELQEGFSSKKVLFRENEPLNLCTTISSETAATGLASKRDGWKWLDQTKSLTATISHERFDVLDEMLMSRLVSHRKEYRQTQKLTPEMLRDLETNHLVTSLHDKIVRGEAVIESVYQKHLYGRWYITNQDCNLQTLPRDVRKILLADKYEYDLDSAHPSIILSIVGKDKIPAVAQYVSNKDYYRKSLAEYCGASKQQVKDTFNAMNNLSKLNPIFTNTMPESKLSKFRNHPFVKAYREDMELAADVVIGHWLNSGRTFHKETSKKPSRMSCVLQNIEAWVMELSERYVPDIELILHDAIYTTTPIPESILNRIISEAKELYGIDIRFG